MKEKLPHSIHVLVPMSGQGTRYQKAGYQQPKPLIPVSGTPMISRLLKRFPERWPSSFVLAENHRETQLESILKQDRGKSAQIHYVIPHTLGPGKAIQAALDSIPNDAPVLVSYCDYDLVWDPIQFEEFVTISQCDACVISYRGFHAHYLRPTPYAYSRLEGENVVEVREKGSFTDNRENEYASCGAYYFRTAALLRAALEFQFENQVQCNGEYYTSLTVQALLLQDPKADVRVFEIPYFCQWGTPEDLQRYEYWERSYQSYLRYSKPKEQVHVGQVMIPMAGAGSRFKSVTPVLKPFIPVGARPMYEEAISTLPRSENVVIVALESFEEEIKKSSLGKKIRPTFLKETPSGQALSVEAGIKGLDLEQEVLISSCDHGIVLNPDLWRKFAEAPNCDAAIFTIQGFPGASERPNAFAYVVPKQKLENSLFLQVERVSVKRPVSANPSQDHLLVGTFWFKNGKILQKGIEELKKRDIRVNSELYLDSVFECLMEMGHSVRMIPLDGYLCWGDPDSLAETLYWKEFFACTPIEKRKRYPGVQNR